MPAPERLVATRIVATLAALDAGRWPEGALVLRLAPDEVLVLAEVGPEVVDDPHAIVERETGFFGLWLPAAEALAALERTSAWELPRARPAFAQGGVADLPVKLWLEEERVLVVVPAPFASDLAERLR